MAKIKMEDRRKSVTKPVLNFFEIKNIQTCGENCNALLQDVILSSNPYTWALHLCVIKLWLFFDLFINFLLELS